MYLPRFDPAWPRRCFGFRSLDMKTTSHTPGSPLRSCPQFLPLRSTWILGVLGRALGSNHLARLQTRMDRRAQVIGAARLHLPPLPALALPDVHPRNFRAGLVGEDRRQRCNRNLLLRTYL